MGDAAETGDRPLSMGSQPILVDTSADPKVPDPQGDRQVENTVSLVRDDQRPTPTAGEYRQAGYLVSGEVMDDAIPPQVFADQPGPATVHLVDTPPVLPMNRSEEAQPSETDEGATPEPDEGADSESVPEPSPTAESAPEQETAEERQAGQAAEEKGKQAARAGEPRSSNPYDGRTADGKAWNRGWDYASEDVKPE
jgi:hypothetical protein